MKPFTEDRDQLIGNSKSAHPKMISYVICVMALGLELALMLKALLDVLLVVPMELELHWEVLEVE